MKWSIFKNGKVDKYKEQVIDSENELKFQKDINNAGYASNSVSYPENSPFMWNNTSGLSGGSAAHFRLFYIFKNYNYSKWEYKNLPDGLTKERIENLLFLWGKCMIFKYKDEYIATNFVVDSWKSNFCEPNKVKAVGDDSKFNYPKSYTALRTVNKDCIIIYNDTGNLWTKQYFGKIWIIIDLINEMVETEKQLKLTRILLNQKINVSQDTPDELVQALNSQWKNTQNIVLRFNPAKSLKNAGSGFSNDIFTFDNNLDALENHYQVFYDRIKELFGCNTNSNIKKKERQINREITNNNTISNSINRVELEFRENAVKKFNELFGTNWIIELLDSEQEMMPENENENKKETKENEKI